MAQPRQRIQRTIAVVFTLFIIHSLPAAPNVAVLPFRVSGEVDPLLFTRSELPWLLGQATHFLVGTTLDYPVLALAEASSAADRQNYRPESAFTAEKGAALCVDTGSTYLLVGSLNMAGKDQAVLNLISFHCKSSQVTARGRQSGSVSQLQQMLREAVVQSMPFARQRRFAVESRPSSPLDLGVVLDTSGSMAPLMPQIHALLRSVGQALPGRSRMAAWILEDRQGEKVERIGLTTNAGRLVEALEARLPAGEISIKTLEMALSQVRGEPFANQKKLIVLSDVRLGQNQAPVLEDQLRQLRAAGFQTALYSLPSQGTAERQEWARLRRALGLEDPQLIWARRLGFLQGFSIYLTQVGSRFYRANTDIKTQIEQNRLDLESLVPLETAAYAREELTLFVLPEAYARRENLKLTGSGPLVTNLEKQGVAFVQRGTVETRAAYRVLVQNEGQAFWVQVDDAQTFRDLVQKEGQQLYVGLRFAHNKEGELVNLPAHVYLRSQKDVPRLFINTRTHILRVPRAYIQPSDVWFFHVTIKESSGAGTDLLE